MTASLTFCRRSFSASAALLIAVGLVIAIGVIPAVKSDTLPFAAPERAVPAFWVNVVITLVVAATLLSIAARTAGRTRRLSFGLGLLAFVVLLLAFALIDADAALQSHGPELQTATQLLFYSAAADLIAAVLVIVTAFLLPKRA